MKVKITPIWKLQTRSQMWFALGVSYTKWSYMAGGGPTVLTLELLLFRIEIHLN